MHFLLDEMTPPALADQLTEMGHDAVHVRHLGLTNTPDVIIGDTAQETSRIIVTNNFRDYTNQRGIVILFYSQQGLPLGGAAQAAVLARRIVKWLASHPEPYLGPHWI